MPGARVETVTVMFTDVVGSTALRARVGEDEAERLRLAHDAIVGQAVEEQGGTVVKHLGDGVMATFSGAAAAVGAAVAIQQGLDRFNRDRRNETIHVRIGISAGDVSVEGGDYFGLPVVEAQRLEASATPATIRCASLVKDLSRGRGEHEFTDLGLLELKGLSDHVHAFEVGWTPLDARSPSDPPALPPVLALAGGMPFSGRATALSKLLELAKHCAHDSFAVALVAGEPGIGKTRLAHELALRVVADGGQVVAGRCDEDVSAPFQAVRAALDWYVEHLADGDPNALGAHPGELVRLLPDLPARVSDLPPPLKADAEAERYRLLQALESWLRAAADRRPLLMVLDDIQWADKETLVLLHHLVRAAPERVFIVCTYRDTDVDRTHPLASMLADLRRLPGVERMALSGLPADEVREFLERAGGHELDESGEAFAELLVRETSGNPFFVSELLRHFIESGLLVREGGRWTGDLHAGEARVPEGIREVVGRRLGRLGEDAEEALRAASVIGYEFDVELLSAVLDQPTDDVIDALEVAEVANIVVEVGVGRFRFSHALVRETLHDELSSTRRARRHRQVALAIERLHPSGFTPVVLTELATHWREASAGGDPTRAVELAIQVGDEALAGSAPDSAVAWYSDAIEMMEGEPGFDDLRRRTLVRLAEAQVRSGDPRHRATSATAARSALDAGDAETAVAALTVHWRTSFSEFDEADEDKIEMLQTALADLDLDDVQRADLTGELATELIFTRDIDGRRRALEEFERLTEAFDSGLRAALLISSYGRTSNTFGRGFNQQLREAAAHLPDDDSTHSHATLAVGSGLAASDREAIDQALERWLPIVDADEPFSRSNSVVWRIPILVMEGRIDEAEATAEELLGLMRDLHIPERGVYRATTSLGIARERDTLPAIVGFWEPAAERVHPSSATAAAVAFLAMATGDADRAATMLDAFDADQVADDAGYPMAIGLMGEVVAALGSADQCQQLLRHLAPGAGDQIFTGGIHLGPVDRLTGLLHDRLGDHDEAERWWRRAIEQAGELRSPTWLARTHLDVAESRLTRSLTAEAAASLDAARSVLADVDLPASAARLAELTKLATC